MSPVVSDPPPAGSRSKETDLFVSRLSHLRGIRWRIDLCGLRCSSIDDLRRVTADSRRRYAVLRRRLLVDLHILKDGSSSPNLVMDNPLSESPDSMWGRFFRNAELEKMLDQDLSRLYPEHGSYFQTHGCQSMLRRILLLWCLRHPEYGYRQGMHELLAPLLYVLHADLHQLAEARRLYEDHFTDKFDDALFQENDLSYNFDFRRSHDFMENDAIFEKKTKRTVSLDELDPPIQTIVLLSDAYGAEGELGVVLSEKFMEHDVYCMFDALMSGAGGAVAMAEFFSPSSGVSAGTGLSPVIDASATLYHLLSLVDSSLYSHLVELGVEPQYFALRWLRVLFGREFSLDDLLIIWDEIFSYDNVKLGMTAEYETGSSSSGVLNSRRGAFISAMAVSMMLNLRASLLATETATSCLQRLLNFPDNTNLEKLIEKAKSLLSVALDISTASSYPASGSYDQKRSSVVRGHSLSFDSSSPQTPHFSVPESYWEEKWRDLHKEEELKKGKSSGKQTSTLKKGWTEKLKSRLYRTESEPSPSQSLEDGMEKQKPFTGRSLLQDLSKQLGEFIDDGLDNEPFNQKNTSQDKHVVPQHDLENRGGIVKTCSGQSTPSFEKSTICSEPGSPISARDSNSIENDLEKSSNDSNESQDICRRDSISEDQTSVSRPSSTSDSPELAACSTLKDKKSLSGKFQWLLKLGRRAPGEGPSIKGNAFGVVKFRNDEGKSSVPEEVGYIKETDRSSTPDVVRYKNEANKGNSPELLTMTRCTDEEGKGNAPEAVRCTDVAAEGSAPVVVRYTIEADDDITSKAVRHPSEVYKGNSAEAVVCTNETDGEDDPEVIKHTNEESQRNTEAAQSTAEQNCSAPTLKENVSEQKPIYSLRNIGQSMLENIQVIESVFQHDAHQAGSTDSTSKNALVEKGQATAMSALKELRKISNLLSEM